MFNFQLREFIKENIPDFNERNPQDVIRAEKLLKSESKLNGTFNFAEIEDFILNIKNLDFNFDEIFEIEEIRQVCKGEYIEIELETSEVLIEDVDENNLESFANFYESAFLDFFRKGMLQNDWSNLQMFYSKYFLLISENLENELIDTFIEKNEVLAKNFDHFQQLDEYLKVYPFAANPDYFLLQSQLGRFEFTESVMMLNNRIINRQNTSSETNRVIMGEMLIALSFFQPFDEENAKVLHHNRIVGEEWTQERKSFLDEILSFAADIVKDQNMLAINIGFSMLFLFLIILGFITLAKAEISYFITFTFIAVIVAAAFFGQLNEKFNFFEKVFFPVYIFKGIASITIILVFSAILSLILSGVFGVLIDFSNNKGSLGFLVFPIVWLLIRFFSRKN